MPTQPVKQTNASASQKGKAKPKFEYDPKVIVYSLIFLVAASVITYVIVTMLSMREQEEVIKRFQTAHPKGVTDMATMSPADIDSFKKRLTSEVTIAIDSLKQVDQIAWNQLNPLGDDWYNTVAASVDVKTEILNDNWDCGKTFFSQTYDTAAYESGRSLNATGAGVVDGWLKGRLLTPIEAVKTAILTCPLIIDQRYIIGDK